MTDIEIGMGKTARRGWRFDELAIVPSRRTRDAADVDVSWKIDAYRFDLPVLGAPMDSVTSPASAAALGALGGVGVLDLEGLWTRHADADALLAELAELDDAAARERLRRLHETPVDPDLLVERLAEIRAAGVRVAARVGPRHAADLTAHALQGEVDLLVIKGTVVSAEHVARTGEPLNLKTFIRGLEIPVVVGGCASYRAALHLMRTGAAGITVGVGSEVTSTMSHVTGVAVPLPTALADARAARMRHLDETGVYCHVIADGGVDTAGDLARAVVCGADAVMLGEPLAAATDAPGRGWHWGPALVHPDLSRGVRRRVEPRGSLAEILTGPARDADGRTDLIGGLRRAMATCGYTDIKDFQKAELIAVAGGAR